MHNKERNYDPFKVKVLLIAFTNKATFNIDGSTIHFVLNIPINQLLTNLIQISFEVLNDLTCHYEQLQLVVIDKFH